MISLKNIKTVFKKEFLQVMRDKSVLMTNFFLPLFGLPLYFLLVFEAVTFGVKKDLKPMHDKTVFQVSYQGELRETLGKFLEQDEKIQLTPLQDGFEETEINDFQKKHHAYQEKRKGFSAIEELITKQKINRKKLQEQLEESEKAYSIAHANLTEKYVKKNDLHIAIFKSETGRYNTYLFYSSENPIATNAQRYVIDLLIKFKTQIVSEYKKEKGVENSKLSPIEVHKINVDKSANAFVKTIGVGMGSGIMFILLIAIFNPAINTTIGERDNKTFKVLLMNPISLHEIFIGKYLSVAFQGLLALIPYSLEAIIFYSWGSSNYMFINAPKFGFFDFFLIFLGTITVAIFISAVCFLTSSFAKTRNQAQSLMSLLMFAMIIPIMTVGAMDLKLNMSTAFVPMVNFPLITEFIAMKGTNYLPVITALLVNIVTSLGIIWFSIDAFTIQWKGKADVQGVSDLLNKKRRKSSKLTPAHAFLAFALCFLGMTYGSLAITLLKVEILNYLFAPILFILGTALFIFHYSGMDITRALKWNHIKESYTLRVSFSAVLLSLMFNLIMANSIIKDIAGVEVPQLFESNVFMATLSYFLLFAFLPSITEEILFRGVIFKGFRGQYNFVTSSILSSALFAIVHFSMFRWAHTFTLGIALAYLYEKKGITTCILFHMLFNATSLGLGALNQQTKFLESTPESLGFLLAPIMLTAAYFMLKLKNEPKEETSSEDPPSQLAA